MSIRTMPAEQAQKLLASAHKYGADVDELLESTGLILPRQDELHPHDLAVPADLYCKLLQKVAYATHKHWFGLPGTERDPVGGFRMLCRIVAHCRTLEQAIARATEFYSLYGLPGWGFTLRRDGDRATLSICTRDMGTAPQFKTVHYMYILHRFWAWLSGQYMDLREVNLVRNPCHSLDAYRELFDCEIRFNQQENSLVFDSSYLDAPMVHSEQALMDFVETAPYELLLAPQDKDDSITAKIRYLIGSDFTRPMPSFDEIIDRLHTSASTLRRKLKREGTTYQKIKDDARREAAMAYLKRSDLSVTTSAFLMGFDDPSAFTRSFKRWTGLAPSEYRARYVSAGKRTARVYPIESASPVSRTLSASQVFRSAGSGSI